MVCRPLLLVLWPATTRFSAAKPEGIKRQAEAKSAARPRIFGVNGLVASAREPDHLALRRVRPILDGEKRSSSVGVAKFSVTCQRHHQQPADPQLPGIARWRG